MPSSEIPSNSAAVGPPTKSQNFWLSTGNVLLQTTVNPTTQYRLHGYLLAAHSDKLKEMIKNAGGGTTTKLSAGAKYGQRMMTCVIIYVSGASTDWDLVLPIFYGTRRSPVLPLPVLLALQRIDHIYTLHLLSPFFDAQIAKILPTTFEDWQYNYVLSTKDEWRKHIEGNEVALVRAVEEMGPEEGVAMARYLCLSERDLVDIVCSSNDDDAAAAAVPQQYLSTPQRRILLDAHDKIRKRGLELTYGWWRAVRTVGDGGSVSCTNQEGCKKVIRGAQREMALQAITMKDALLPTTLMVKCDQLCNGCREEEADARENGMRELFDELARLFGAEVRE